MRYLKQTTPVLNTSKTPYLSTEEYGAGEYLYVQYLHSKSNIPFLFCLKSSTDAGGNVIGANTVTTKAASAVRNL